MNQDEIIRTLLEASQREREAAVEALLAPLTPRERSLIRDAAVMAFVLGTLHGRSGRWGDPHPKDSAVYEGTLSAASVHFETLARVAREPEGYSVLRGEVHHYSDIGGTVPTLDHPVVRQIWNWIIDANNGVNADVDDLIQILDNLGAPCPADLEEH